MGDDDPDTYAALETWLKSLSEVISKSAILNESGYDGDDDTEGSAYDTAKKRAASQSVSVDEVLKADPDLARQYSEEMRSGS